MTKVEGQQRENKNQQQQDFVIVSSKDNGDDDPSSPFSTNYINAAEDDGTKKTDGKMFHSNLLMSSSITLLFAAQMCNNFGWYALLVELPNFIKQIIGYDYITDRQNALLSLAPYLSMCVFSLFWTFSLDWAWSRGYINVKTVRQLSTGTASLLPAACYIGGVGLMTGGCDRRTVLALSTIGTMFMAGAYCAILTKSKRNKSKDATVNSSSVTFVPGFIVPVFEVCRPHQPTNQKHEMKHWQVFLLATATVLTFEMVLYIFINFIQIEMQPTPSNFF